MAYAKDSQAPRIIAMLCERNEGPNLTDALPVILFWVDEAILVGGDPSDNTT